MLNLKMKLSGKLTTVNKIYLRGRYGGVYLAPEVKKYRDDVFQVVQDYAAAQQAIHEGGRLKVKVDIHSNFFTKGGAVKRMDVDNFIKATIDSVFPPLGVDDMYIFDLNIRKVQYEGQPYVTIKIKEELPNNKKK